MATQRGLAWVLLGGLVVGLLAVSGCQEGAATRAGTVVEPKPVEMPPDAKSAGPETAGSVVDRGRSPDGTLQARVERQWPAEDANTADVERAVETVSGPVELEDEAAVAKAVGPPVELRLRFSPGETAIYTVTTESQKSVEWAGSASTRPATFRGGHTGTRIEMTFEQRVESVGADGDATLAITITALKYTSRVRDAVVLDFDSAAEKDEDMGLAALIGQSYTIQMSAKGEVLSILGAAGAREAAQSGSRGRGTAGKLLSDAEIKDRHAVAALAASTTRQTRAGQTWSDVKTFNFGMMGGKSYERIYTLTEVLQRDAGPAAVLEMKAIPSAATAEAMHEQATASLFAGRFDNTESYTGRGTFDLGSGALLEYSEYLRTEWVVAEPVVTENEAEPAALRMGATHRYRLERVE